jgi:small subunit ribosomal protein S13
LDQKLVQTFLKAAGVDGEKNSNDLTNEEVNAIRAELDNYTVEGDLRREVGLNIKRLKT